MNYKVSEFEKHSDQRGDLIVFLKKSELGKAYKHFGQIYFVTFEKKGTIRGNHYHNKWHEWFGIVAGKIKVYLVDVKTHEEVTIILDAKKSKYMRLEIGPNIAHTFQSLTNYAALINYADSEWYADDTVHYKITQE